MNSLQALLLGLLQGLTEYLPVSSSGHLAIGAYLFGVDGEESMAFTIVVHVATVLSTLVILWREIVWILRGVWCQLTGKVSAQSAGSSSCSSLNAETRYAINILISMIPVGIVGLFFKEQVEEIFGSGLTIVGIMLLVTAALLVFSYYARPRQRENISPLHAFLIGIGQALAVMPGLSRSGTTIATGLLLGNKKESMAQFSFLMVIPPILGEALLDVLKLMKGDEAFGDIEFLPLAVGFLAAFVSGCAACRWMISIVRKGKLLYFGIYCALVALLVLFFA
ncbi:MAG: undecaprenyl-diphosphate phosphatase [Paraprevotella sp.]|nr:undecaprenyl-diphosphate phosphatase [Bacteroidaceae bacterium]MDD6758300.1 undecaprenyl-diphosphate phosphatase [Paraprevotella sp.]MDD6822111.1 undecaprenyl-diphosphate phosphatase [Paraprevotella sp.]MDY3820713.1 undecaprenyl-diphosphate phosphatase [Bacteroidaceae bacterium]MDY4998731.1 undecaprenyl-diphosphate phosphatase [Bacteroidaceae bacterium]